MTAQDVSDLRREIAELRREVAEMRRQLAVLARPEVYNAPAPFQPLPIKWPDDWTITCGTAG